MSYKFSLILLVCLMSYQTSANNFLDVSEDDRLDANFVEDSDILVPDIIRKYGYGAEVHKVTTEDGYILELHRITNSPRLKSQNPKYPVVYCIHGTAETSGTFVLTGPNKAFAYYMADAGFDIWMANLRGNRYSDKHRTLNTNSPEYWDFSFHEIGYYDLPASIDYILNVTNEDKLSSIGFSLGTNVLLIMGATRPEYNHKIHQIHLWGTPMFSIHPKPELKELSKNILSKFDKYGELLKFDAVSFLPSFFQTIHFFCGIRLWTQAECRIAVANFFNDAKHNDDPKQFAVFLGHTTAGVSARTFLHYSQMISYHKFSWYNYGEIRNIFIYGKPDPPEYKLSRIMCPVAIHYSQGDDLTPEEEMVQLGHSLPNLMGLYKVADNHFSHSEFAFGNDAIEMVYSKTRKLIMGEDV